MDFQRLGQEQLDPSAQCSHSRVTHSRVFEHTKKTQPFTCRGSKITSGELRLKQGLRLLHGKELGKDHYTVSWVPKLPCCSESLVTSDKK